MPRTIPKPRSTDTLRYRRLLALVIATLHLLDQPQENEFFGGGELAQVTLYNVGRELEKRSMI